MLYVSRIDTLFLLHRITRYQLFKLTPFGSQSLTLPVSFVFICAITFSWVEAQAIELTNYFEVHLVKNVSTTWQTVALDNSYANAIVICTYQLAAFNAANPPAVTRVRNITSNSFDLRIQGWEDSAATANDVHCMIVDEGVHTLPDGRQLEAHSVLSDQATGQSSTDGTGWNQSTLEDVSASIVHTYTNPVVLGQVMSFNDNRASVINVSDCDSRVNNPFQSGMADGICVGKHIGQIPDTRNPETIGYIVAEAGSGTVNNVFYELALGADAVAGLGSNPVDSYPLATDHTVAVLTQSSEDGGNGSWAVLFGNDSLPDGSVTLQVDEDVFAGDTSRRHTNEAVYYWAFAAAEVTLEKVVINDDSGVALNTDFTLSATGVDFITGVHGDDSITDQPVHPGTYTLSEINIPGYVASAWSCVGGTVSAAGEISLVSGDNVVCTIVNDDVAVATLTLLKQVNNDAGGAASAADFTLAFDDGAGFSGSGVAGSADVTAVSVNPGLYTLSESAVNGYLLTGIQCDGADPDGLDGLNLASGENVTCQFINDDQGVDLEIVKSVSDTSPNIGDVLTFTLSVTNAGADPATNLTVKDIVPAGFSYVASSIVGGATNDDTSPAGSGLAWTLANLAPGAGASLTFQATVLAP